MMDRPTESQEIKEYGYYADILANYSELSSLFYRMLKNECYNKLTPQIEAIYGEIFSEDLESQVHIKMVMMDLTDSSATDTDFVVLGYHTRRGKVRRIFVHSFLFTNLHDDHYVVKNDILRYIPDEDEGNTQLACPICMNLLAEACSTKCGHIFCQRCIEISIERFKKCPICATELRKKHIHRVYLPSSN